MEGAEDANCRDLRDRFLRRGSQTPGSQTQSAGPNWNVTPPIPWPAGLTCSAGRPQCVSALCSGGCEPDGGSGFDDSDFRDEERGAGVSDRRARTIEHPPSGLQGTALVEILP